MDYKKIVRLAQKYEKDTANILSKMIELPSESLQEKDVANYTAEQMSKYNFDEVRFDGLGNVIGKIGDGEKVMAFDAHIDTVGMGNPNLWNRDPFSGEISEGKVWGRGASDQSGGMASMITAGRIIKELELYENYTIYFTGSIMEEDCDGLCWNYIIEEEKIKPQLVVITEPTSCRIHRGQRGRMEMTLSVDGVSAHGSAPERGENAVYKMAEIVKRIEKYNEDIKNDDFLGKGTIVVSQIKSISPSLCAVPDRCSIHIDRRLTKGETLNRAIGELKELTKDFDLKIEVPYYEVESWKGTVYGQEKYFPTWVIEEGHPYIQKSIDVYEKLFDEKPVVDKWTFSTNGVSIMGKHHIPIVGFGPGEERLAHAPNEYCEIEHLVKASAMYAGMVGNIL